MRFWIRYRWLDFPVEIPRYQYRLRYWNRYEISIGIGIKLATIWSLMQFVACGCEYNIAIEPKICRKSVSTDLEPIPNLKSLLGHSTVFCSWSKNQNHNLETQWTFFGSKEVLGSHSRRILIWHEFWVFGIVATVQCRDLVVADSTLHFLTIFICTEEFLLNLFWAI